MFREGNCHLLITLANASALRCRPSDRSRYCRQSKRLDEGLVAGIGGAGRRKSVALQKLGRHSFVRCARSLAVLTCPSLNRAASCTRWTRPGEQLCDYDLLFRGDGEGGCREEGKRAKRRGKSGSGRVVSRLRAKKEDDPSDREIQEIGGEERKREEEITGCHIPNAKYLPTSTLPVSSAADAA